MSDVTEQRGKRYGHPRDHFTRTCAILAVVFPDTKVSELRPQDWAVVMQCDKLARFSETLDDEDSQTDIGGYSETWFMAKEPDPDDQPIPFVLVEPVEERLTWCPTCGRDANHDPKGRCTFCNEPMAAE